MANVSHKDLTGVNLHEPKGVASAASGSVYVATGSGSGVWTPQITPGIVTLASATITGTPSTVDFVSGGTPSGTGITGTGTVVLDNTYDWYEIKYNQVTVGTSDPDFQLRIGTGGGPTYITSGYSYDLIATSGTAQGAISLSSRSGLGANFGLNSSAGPTANGSVRFFNPESTIYPTFLTDIVYLTAGNTLKRYAGAGLYPTGQAYTAVRFLLSAGTFTGGRFTLYGFKKS